MISMPHLFNTNLLNVKLIKEKADLRGGQHVADFGCGKFGHFSFLAAGPIGSGGLVYAVDVVKENLEQIKKEADIHNVKNVTTVWSDLEMPRATAIKPGSLDRIFLVNILHEAKEPYKILAEALRLLKPKAKLIIVDWKRIASPFGPKKESKLDT
ncbi:MAG: hypothetical protein UT42_C0053G0001, partial [Candidatus Falkowbacteria bacterium GW2011_GWA2_39_24]